jgi:hypothetical protein
MWQFSETICTANHHIGTSLIYAGGVVGDEEVAIENYPVFN